MCIDFETLLKVIGLLINASIPILIFILGIKVTKKVEDAKNESAKKYFWETRISDTFFNKFTIYSENVSDLIANLELLRGLIEENIQNEPNGLALQNKINLTCKTIFKSNIEIKIYINMIFQDKDNIIESFDRIWELISSLINNRQGNILEIYDELTILNKLIAKQFNKGY